jgi:hypothetical protein
MGGRGTIAAVVLIALTALLPAAPARAAAVYVELNPETVQAGFLVGIRASCDDNTKPASVESEAFGEVDVHPQFEVLTAAVTVPVDTGPRRYTVRLTCPGGGSASARLNVLPSGRPSEGPATGFGGTAGDDRSAGFLIGGGLVAILAAVVLGTVTRRRRRA